MEKDETGQDWKVQLYRPSPPLFLTEVAFCAIALFVILSNGYDLHPLAWAVYTFSTYVLGIGIYFLVLTVKWFNRTKFMENWRENKYVVARMMLYLDLAFSTIYAVILVFTGIDSDSPWMYAAGGYYFYVGLTSYILIRGRIHGDGIQKDDVKKCFAAGVIMVLLTAAVITMVLIAINGHDEFEYPGVMIYAAALFTFIFFIAGIVNIIRYRGYDDPVFCTVKRYRMNKAIFSMFLLQLAMFAAFSTTEMDAELEEYLNVGIGAAVCIAVALISFYQLYYSYRLKKITE